MKKTLKLSLLATAAAPLALVVSCGEASSSNAKNKHNISETTQTTTNVGNGNNGTNQVDQTPDVEIVQSNLEQGAIVSSFHNRHDDMWGKRSFVSPDTTLLNDRNMAEYRERIKNGKPFGLHFNPCDVEHWDKNNDADGAFSRGTIPLKNREWAIKTLNSQLKNRLDILAALSRDTSRTQVGTTSFDNEANRIFTMWSNINSMVHWGGSTSEGLMITPKAGDINAAHKNGVPILGTIFFPPNKFGGNERMYREMIVKDGDRYPVADNMIAMAKYYGFDGWFFNMETTPMNDMLKEPIREFLKYFHAKANAEKLTVNLYDWNLGSTYVHDQDISDLISVDFQNRPEDYGQGDKVAWGYNFDRGGLSGYDEGGEWDTYNKNSWVYTYFRGHDSLISDEVDLKFFDDSQGHRDLRYSHGTDAFHEAGKNFLQRTVINGESDFSTSFQIGGGKTWYTNGVAQTLAGKMLDGWRNIGVQSVLPTWKYILDRYNLDMELQSTPGDDISIGGTTFKVTIDDEGGCYNGSTKLHLKGKLEGESILTNRLFAANATLSASNQFSFVVEGDENTPQVAVWTEDSDTPTLLASSSKTDLGNKYFKHTFDVTGDLVGKKMTSFGLAFKNSNGKATIAVPTPQGPAPQGPAPQGPSVPERPGTPQVQAPPSGMLVGGPTIVAPPQGMMVNGPQVQAPPSGMLINGPQVQAPPSGMLVGGGPAAPHIVAPPQGMLVGGDSSSHDGPSAPHIVAPPAGMLLGGSAGDASVPQLQAQPRLYRSVRANRAATPQGSRNIDIDCSISQLSFTLNKDKTSEEANAVTEMSNDGNWIFAGNRNARISWKMDDESKVDHYIIYNASHDGQYSKEGVLDVTPTPAAYLEGLPFQQNVPLVIEAVDGGGNVISSNHCLLRTTFEPMNDKTKWTEKYVHDDKTSEYIMNTVHGHTTSYKDEDGNVYFADDYANVFKIDSHGHLNKKGDGEWGTHLLEEYRDVKIRFIGKYDDTHIIVVTQNGTMHLLDKETGKQVTGFNTNTMINTIREYAIRNRITLLDKDIIHNIVSTERREDKTIYTVNYVAGSTINTMQVAIDVHGATTLNPITTSTSGAIVQRTLKTVHETKAIIKKNNKLYIADATINEQGFISGFTNEIELSSKVGEFVNGAYAKNIQTAISTVKNIMDGSEAVTNAEIVKMEQFDDGTILMVNEAGLVIKLKDGNITTSSLIDGEDWKDIIAKIYACATARGHQNVGIGSFRLVDLMKWIKDFELDTIFEEHLINFDKEHKTVTVMRASDFYYAFWGHCRVLRKFEQFDLTKTLSGTHEDFLTPTASEDLLTDQQHSIGAPRFFEFTHGSYVLGGAEGKLTVIDPTGHQTPFGQKQFIYDGNVITSLNTIYDDGDRTIPEYLMQ